MIGKGLDICAEMGFRGDWSGFVTLAFIHSLSRVLLLSGMIEGRC